MTSGTGKYSLGEMVYEGKSIYSANATAYVKEWYPTANILIVQDTSGVFKVGTEIKGAISGATYTINTFAKNNYQLNNLTIVPNPLTANATDDFGFTETLIEY
jgi:hypothetical protein